VGSGNAGYGNGIYIGSNDIIDAGGGSITMHGQGGTTTGDNNMGILNNGTIQTTNNGNITLTGIGGTTSDGTAYNIGVSNGNYWAYTSGTIQVTGSGTGGIIIIGTGGNGGDDNSGINNSGLIQTSGSGNIILTGIGGSGSVGPYPYNDGVDDWARPPNQIVGVDVITITCWTR